MITIPRILIADDNPQNIYLLESILKGRGFGVVSARNGAEALEAARNDPPDLIVTDILMPVMDGFELCRQWKKDDRLRLIPFVFYTATYTDPKDERFALSLGAERFIVKPQKPEILVQIIEEVLEESPKRQPYAESDEMETLRQYNEVLFRKLEKKMHQLEEEIMEHRKAEERALLANRKLTLLTEVTNQDIQNKVTALRALAQLSRDPQHEEERDAFLDRQIEILGAIQNLIQKTKVYQQMGIDQSLWTGIEAMVRMQMALQSQNHGIEFECNLSGVEIYTDPLIARVFYNLIHNTLRHGNRVTRISFSYRECPDGLVLVCGDDGIGIPADQKAAIFDRIVGGEGKFGLFFAREFLSLSGMTIKETGISGKGARFEITVPKGAYRFAGQ